MERAHGKCLYIILSVMSIKAMAQTNEPLERLNVKPFGSARSKFLEAGPKDRIVIRPEQDGQLIPSIFIYEKTIGPVAKNREDGDDAAFQWTAVERGYYQIVIYSKGDVEVTYTIQRLGPKPDRGVNPPPKPSGDVVPVYFATNRKKATLVPPEFSAEPNEDGSLSYGVFEVSVPRDHKMG